MMTEKELYDTIDKAIRDYYKENGLIVLEVMPQWYHPVTGKSQLSWVRITTSNYNGKKL